MKIMQDIAKDMKRSRMKIGKQTFNKDKAPIVPFHGITWQ
jgi:hypothetical protein